MIIDLVPHDLRLVHCLVQLYILRSQLPQASSLGSRCWGRRLDSKRNCDRRLTVRRVAKSSFRTG